MRGTHPKVFLLSRPELNMSGVQAWLDHLGASQYRVFSAESEAENLIMMAAKRCYMSFEVGLNPNVKRIREDATKYLTNILDVKHGSVLEHSYFVFAVEDVSRVFTAEMNRHGDGTSISEGSMRFIRFTDIPFWMPESARDSKDDPPEILEKKKRTREIMTFMFTEAEFNYTELVDLWDMDNLPDFKSKKQLTSMMRRIIPMGVSSGGVWGGNVRALRHILTMRNEEGAEEEILMVAKLMLNIMMKECPILFGDFSVNEKGFWGPKYVKV